MFEGLMMISGFATHTSDFTFGGETIQLILPDAASVQQRYTALSTEDKPVVFPFWSKLWPASLGLCEFIAAQPYYIKDKTILELAAGLGLPSLLSALYAKQVICTDIVPEAVEFAQHSANLSKMSNMRCSILDWNSANELVCDTLLLSDVNYNSAQFEKLYTVIYSFLEKGTTIIISTPQRLMAKPFVQRLLPFCIDNKECMVRHEQTQTTITILVLGQTPKG